MGRIYSAHGDAMDLGTGSVLIALRTATGVNAASILQIHRLEVSQAGSTTSAMVRLLLSTRNTAGTLTTTSVTPQPLRPVTGPASGLTGNTSVIGASARIGINSSADSGGTYTDHWTSSPNQLNGYLYHPVPEERIIVPPDTVWVARFAVAPASLADWAVELVYEELC